MISRQRESDQPPISWYSESMPRRLLPVAAVALFLTAAALAQEPAQTPEPKPATPEAQPAKKPDAFKYFFGRRDEKDNKDAKDSKDKKDAGARTEAAPVKAAEPAAVKEAPPAQAPAPAPVPEPAVAKPAPRVDAFQYFFGKSAQPVPAAGTKKDEPGEKKPLDAFDYLFGKKEPEKKEPARPPGS